MRKYTLLYICTFIWLCITAKPEFAHTSNTCPISDTTASTPPTYDTATVCTSAASDTLPLPFHQRIDSLLTDTLFQTSQIGIMVYDLTADTVVFAHNERQLMRPASTMKLTTAITALDYLGGSYRYTTLLLANGEQHRNVLKGDVIIKGGMDPRFNHDDMNAFVEALQKAKIDTVCGNIFADMSFKDTLMLGSGWCWDDDNPVLTPLLWNRSDGFMPKFRQRLQDANITILPDTCHISDNQPTRATSTASDTCPISDNHPATPDTLVTRHHTLDQILVRMMKESDNLYAESMFYQIAAACQHKGHSATASDAISVIKKLVQKLGLNPADYRFADGSGLSLYNYQTPELQIRLLRYAYRNPNIYTHLYPALPIAAVDGTLKARMQGTNAANNVHAKTGTVTGVSSLSGYLTAANGNTLCFAIINQGITKSALAKQFQDRLCDILCTYK